jgi:hypothetical protein
VDQNTNLYRRLQVLFQGAFLVVLSLAAASCRSHQPSYPPDDSLRKGATLRVPQEFQNGTASAEQAKAWAKVILMGSGTLVTQERELAPGGKRALFISDTSNAGTGGNFYVVFDQTANGMRYLGDIEFGSCRAVGPAASGRPRLVTYWHMSAGEGRLGLWLLTAEGFRAIKSVTIHPGDSGTVEGNRIYEAFFGSKPVTEPLIETTFGVNPIERPN